MCVARRGRASPSRQQDRLTAWRVSCAVYLGPGTIGDEPAGSIGMAPFQLRPLDQSPQGGLTPLPFKAQSRSASARLTGTGTRALPRLMGPNSYSMSKVVTTALKMASAVLPDLRVRSATQCARPYRLASGTQPLGHAGCACDTPRPRCPRHPSVPPGQCDRHSAVPARPADRARRPRGQAPVQGYLAEEKLLPRERARFTDIRCHSCGKD